MVNRPADAPEPDDALPRPGRSATPARSSTGAPAGSSRRGGRRGRPRRREPPPGGPRDRHRDRVASRSVPPIPGLEAIDVWTNERGDARPRAARLASSSSAAARPAASWPRSTPASASRRSIVQSGAAPRPDRPPAQLGGHRRGAPRATASTSGSTSGPRAPGPARERGGAHVIDLSDGSTAEGHAILLAVGRDVPSTTSASRPTGSMPAAGRPSRATGGSASPTGSG